MVYFDISDVDSGYFHLISRPSYVTDSIAAFSELSVAIMFSPDQARQYISYFYLNVPKYNYSSSAQLLGTGITTPILSISPSNISVNNNSGNVLFTVTTNINWSVSDNVSWLTESPGKGTGDGKISVSYEQNLTTKQRVGTMTVSGSGITRTATVTQAPAPFELTVNVSDSLVDNNNGEISLAITSNTDWSISDNVTWLTESSINGTGDGKIVVSYEQNLTTKERIGTITVTGGGITRTVNITQAASPPFLTVSPSDTSVNNNSGNVVLRVNSNRGWSASDTSSWLSENPSNGTGPWKNNSKSRAEFNNKSKKRNSNSNRWEYNKNNYDNTISRSAFSYSKSIRHIS